MEQPVFHFEGQVRLTGKHDATTDHSTLVHAVGHAANEAVLRNIRRTYEATEQRSTNTKTRDHCTHSDFRSHGRAAKNVRHLIKVPRQLVHAAGSRWRNQHMATKRGVRVKRPDKGRRRGRRVSEKGATITSLSLRQSPVVRGTAVSRGSTQGDPYKTTSDKRSTGG